MFDQASLGQSIEQEIFHGLRSRFLNDEALQSQRTIIGLRRPSLVSHMILPTEIEEFQKDVSFAVFSEIERSRRRCFALELFLDALLASGFGNGISQLFHVFLKLLTAVNQLLSRERRPRLLVLRLKFPFRGFHCLVLRHDLKSNRETNPPDINSAHRHTHRYIDVNVRPKEKKRNKIM